MTKLTCTDPGCERAPMRTRDGERWCMYHPEQAAPSIDLHSGRLRGPDGKPKREPKASETLRPSNEGEKHDTGYRAPGRVRTPQPEGNDAPADGICPADGCTRPHGHRGVHAVARVAPSPTSDGLCATDSCDRPWRHAGQHRLPKVNRPSPTTRPPSALRPPLLTPDIEAAVHAWAAELGQSVSEYIRSLIHADLTAQGRLEQAS